MSCFTEEQLIKISNLVKEIEKLNDFEKLMLYLQLPCGRTELNEGKYNKLNGAGKQNPDIFSKKPDQETTQTYTWILSHLEEDPNVSLPKQEVYDEYRSFCQTNKFEPLCVADFGKAMKHAFPCIKPRRLGQRGNSRYCYSGLRKKYKIDPPTLPDINEMSSPAVPSSSSSSSSTSSSSSSSCSANSLEPSTRANCCTDIHNSQQQQQSFNNMTNFGQPPTTSMQVNTIKDVPMSQHLNDKASCMTSNNVHHPSQQQHHHQQQQHQQPHHQQLPHQQQQQFIDPRQHVSYARGFEAMNLKVDSNHQHNQRSSQPPMVSHHISANGDYVDQMQHNIQFGCSKMSNNHNQVVDRACPMTTHISSTTTDQTNQAPAIMNVPQQPNTNEFAQQANGTGSDPIHHDYQGTMNQRFGTPDDDDYRHNYHDLNRPIVSEVIPFSQTGQYELTSGFMYNNHNNTSSTQSASPTQQHQPLHSHQHHQQQQQPHDPQEQHQLGNQQSSIQPDAHANKIQQVLSNGHHHTLTDNHPTPSSCDESAHTSHHHQYQHSALNGDQQINHPVHNLQLNINSINLNNEIADCCASPFQSPASTPYPMMGNFMMQDTQDYYSGECLRYSDH